ncbi:hypothetical protein NDU88_002076 [Pleurodeles waltl]|uniref:Uncharacterized protein n=1 Tax=Pleurodeles waltl TaxID=8319 RepID=A0AAV7KV46_PLEWA|nr:hypothetical protein NDU88_002076 [Pleurodeles waltl]
MFSLPPPHSKGSVFTELPPFSGCSSRRLLRLQLRALCGLASHPLPPAGPRSVQGTQDSPLCPPAACSGALSGSLLDLSAELQ